MMFMRGRGGSDQQDSVESFGGVEQMDPVEAYVQQLVAQGYDEQMARQYATQYYARLLAAEQGRRWLIRVRAPRPPLPW